jgi:subtilisin family serine protease
LLQRLATRQNLLVLAAVSTLFVLLAIAGVVYYLFFVPKDEIVFDSGPSLDELSVQFPQLSSILKDDKLGFVYKQFLVAYKESGPDAAYDLARKRGILNANDEVIMTLELDTTETTELETSLEEHRIKVTAVNGNLMDIAIPVDILQESLESDTPGAVFLDISGLAHVIRIRLPIPIPVNVGDVETEGVEIIEAYDWQAAGYTGKGVKIGVLDVGFDGYQDLLRSDLPANVVAQSFRSGLAIDGTGEVHGTAVAEIMHDIAPDAELFFAASYTWVERRPAIDWLLSQGVDIISSSTGSLYGPKDGTGVPAMMVEEVAAKGILWVNSSGNAGVSHYRGQFTDDDGDSYHEFDTDDEYLGFSTPTSTYMVLTWDDWGSGTQDLNLYIVDDNGEVIVSSQEVQNGAGADAAEYIEYEFPDNGPYYAIIEAVRVNRELTLDFFVNDGEVEYIDPFYSLTEPGDAKSSLTVGATDWNTGELADYSSRGPTSDERLKPEIIAPSNVNSVVYEGPWTGTSAACPHVTGAAALVMQAFPEYTPQQVTEFLLGRAEDMDESGLDNSTGYGHLMLGPPPGSTNVQPLPTQEPAPTQVAIVEATQTLLPTATPSLEEEPEPENNDSGIVTLLLLGCVVLPGFLGLGGIGLLGAAIYTRRKRTASESESMPFEGWDWTPMDQPQDIYSPALHDEEPPPAGKICPNCARKNQADARFCGKCGTELNTAKLPTTSGFKFCTNCGTPLRRNASFCSNCGNKVHRRSD